ncbi:exonuclease domain-containing protein [Streptomyces hayashii]|uniref:3'-5' exonuclease n=1 Tax=Streptomyces hayashii TaxID=2839966 RepID=UPI00403D3472
MEALMDDPRFAGTTLLVIDFEGLTPIGRPAEPVEVAAPALRPMDGRLVEVGRFEELMRPPADVPLTVMDVQLSRASPSSCCPHQRQRRVVAQLKARLTTPPYRPVAHHASTEVGITARQAEHCPVLAATPLLDTLRLAKAVVPGIGAYGLDSPLDHYGIPKPAGRHRATPDVEVTAQVLIPDSCATGARAAGGARCLSCTRTPDWNPPGRPRLPTRNREPCSDRRPAARKRRAAGAPGPHP